MKKDCKKIGLRVSLALVTGIWQSPGSALSEILEVSFKTAAETSSMYINAGDLIEFAGGRDTIYREIKNIRIGLAPRPGYFSVLNRKDVESKVRYNLVRLNARLKWSGPKLIKVSAVGYSLNGREIADEATQYLHNELSGRHSEYSIKLRHKVRDLIIPDGEIKYNFRPIKSDVIKKRTCVWVDLDIDGMHFQSIPIWYEVSIWEDVLVSNEDLNRGEEIRPQSVSMQRRDISRENDIPLVDINELDNVRLKVSINGGAILTRRNIEEIPAVVKGEKVLVLARSGNVYISSAGIAQNDGMFMDTVAIDGIGNAGLYKATVIGNGKVRVD